MGVPRTRAEIKESKRLCEKLGKLHKVFNSTLDKETFLALYAEEREQHSGYHFVDHVISHSDQEAVIEFPGLEYEVKLDITGSLLNKQRHYLNNFLEAILERCIEGEFISNLDAEERNSTNLFYGTEEGESLVIMAGGRRSSLKYKEDTETPKFGFDDEEYVLKREERVLREVPQTDVFSEIERVILEGSRYLGRIKRNRARTEFISVETGRLFMVLFDYCEIEPRNKKPSERFQIEIEYSSCIHPSYQGLEFRSERQMVSELLALSQIIKNASIGVESGYAKIVNAQFTREKKFDYLK